MLAVEIKEIKPFMGALLSAGLFDDFLMEEAVIRTSHTYTIDGHLQKDFYTKEELEDPAFPSHPLIDWKTVKDTCFRLIKGKRTPLLFKVTLHHPDSDSRSLLLQEGCGELIPILKSFLLTIKFDQKGLILTTGTSFSSFVMDRNADRIWDEAFLKFLTQNGISFDQL